MREAESPEVAKTADAGAADAGAAALAPETLRQAMELFFYGYRDVIAEPDRILAGHHFGRAHHRVIHFVRRNPGITVAELLAVLRVTKQSLARVLRQLVDRGFIVQRTDRADRRRRRLYLTRAGEALEAVVSKPQQERLRRAFADAGPEAMAGWQRVLWRLTDEEDRARMRRAGFHPAP